MLSLILWSLAVLAILGLIVFLVFRTKKRMQPPLCVRQAIEAAKVALKNKKQKPKIYRCCKVKRSENLVVSTEIKKQASDQPCNYRFRWPHLDLKYELKDNTESVYIQMEGHKEIVSLLYIEGALASMALGRDRFDAEHFEMRQSCNIADHLRTFLRHHLKLSGGSLEIEKYDEPTFTPVLDVNKSSEIKLKEIPITWAKPKIQVTE